MNKPFEFPKNRQYPPVARFLWFHPCTCEWVKITLQPGQTLAWCHYQQTDEGYAMSHVEFEYSINFEDDDSCPTIFLVEKNDSQDCDGRHWEEIRRFCPLEDLKGRKLEGFDWDEKEQDMKVVEVLEVPAWEPLLARQRDFTAESAGY